MLCAESLHVWVIVVDGGEAFLGAAAVEDEVSANAPLLAER